MAENPQEENHYQILTDFLNLDSNKELISENFVVSKNEVLLAVLKYVRKNTLSNSGLADLCKMIDSFLERPVLFLL